MIDTTAFITPDGAIRMGNSICVDGHSYDVKHFVFSHFHQDHTEKINKCLYNGKVYMSKPTRDLLESISRENYGSGYNHQVKKTNIEVLNYGEPKMIGDSTMDKVTLHESSHVLGSSQIEVVTNTNKKILYSGDISPRDKPPTEVDILIVDSTHGHPRYEHYPDTGSIERRFLEKLVEVLNEAKPVVIHAHRGKLQEIMSVVSQHSALSQFDLYSDSTNIRISQVYKSYKYKIRDKLLDLADSEPGDYPTIRFTTDQYKSEEEKLGSQYSFFFTDKPKPPLIDDETTSIVATTSHPGFKHLLNYVNMAHPTKVIVDNLRSRQGNKFAEQLRSEGYDSEAQPIRY